MNACANCQGILDADAGRHRWTVARLDAGYVWLNQCQYYPGATFYVARGASRMCTSSPTTSAATT
jgi:hypothetical protein